MIKGGRKSYENEIDDAFARKKQEGNKRLSKLIREQREQREQEQEKTVSGGLFGCRGGKKQ
jgi:hypothetical protein